MAATNTISKILEVRINNLFVNGYHIEFPADDEGLLLRDRITFEPSPKDQYHLLIRGQMLDALADKYYSGQVADASKYWWVIADANFVHNPFDLEEFVGKDLLIPDLQRAKLIS